MKIQKFQECPIDVLEQITPLLNWKSKFALKRTCPHFYNLIDDIGITDIYIYDNDAKTAQRKWLHNSPSVVECIQVSSKKVTHLIEYFEDNPEQIKYVKSLTIECAYKRSIGILLDLFETLGHLEKIFFYNEISYFVLKTFGDITLITGEYEKFSVCERYSSLYPVLIAGNNNYHNSQGKCKVCSCSLYSYSTRYQKLGTQDFICELCAAKEAPSPPDIMQTINNEAKKYHLKSVQYKAHRDASISNYSCEDLEIFDYFPYSPTTEIGLNLSSITIRNAKDLQILKSLKYTEKLKSISIEISSNSNDVNTIEDIFTIKTFPVLAVFDLHIREGNSSMLAISFKRFVDVFKVISNIPTLKSLKLHEHFSTEILNRSLLSCLIYLSPFFRIKQTSLPFTFLELDSVNIESCLESQIEEDNVLPDYPIFYWIKKLKCLKTLCIRDIFGLQERIAEFKIEESVTRDIINNDPVIPALAELNAFPLFKYSFKGDVLSDFIPTLQIIANLLPNLEMLNTGGVFIHITRNETVDFKVVGYTRQ